MSSKEYERRKEAAYLEEILLDEPTSNAFLKLVPGCESWTDEQWTEHDRKIADERARQVAEDEHKRRVNAVASAGFPKRAIDAAIKADESTEAISRIKAWDHREQSILVLSGPAGCGKTVAATWWALRTDYVEFMRSSAFAAGSRYDADARAKWLEAHRLVLDDLGTEFADSKGNYLVDLDELIDTFYGDKRPLLITTNCTKQVFTQRYGARIVDRIRECGVWFQITGKSMRGQP